ncbi:MAG: CARDB domain-containing protein [Candidatus Omnitrophica bacterium]|nr:CARDB domain-containing protein [Candidatus Omnitrophota bacterium]
MRRAKIFPGFIILLICFCAVPSGYAGSNLSKAQALPDLVINSIDFIPAPEHKGRIEEVRMGVVNKGPGDAAGCVLNLTCRVVKCDEGDSCDEFSRAIAGDIAVPPLKRGEKAEVTWRPASPMRWVAGKYSVAAGIDKYNSVNESNEENNVNKSFIYIKSFSSR